MINWAMKPSTNLPSIYAKKAADAVSPNNQVGSPIRGFVSGALEGAGHVVDDMTSPIGIASMVAPWLRGAKPVESGILSLGRLAEARGISPSMLPSELISSGMESGYNAPRIAEAAKYAQGIEDTAYDANKIAGKVRMPVGGDIDVAELMRKLNAYRGK